MEELAAEETEEGAATDTRTTFGAPGKLLVLLRMSRERCTD